MSHNQLKCKITRYLKRDNYRDALMRERLNRREKGLARCVTAVKQTIPKRMGQRISDRIKRQTSASHETGVRQQLQLTSITSMNESLLYDDKIGRKL